MVTKKKNYWTWIAILTIVFFLLLPEPPAWLIDFFVALGDGYAIGKQIGLI